ncbi:unnamed protein product [Leuciscus chuanchicus]
MEFTDILDSLEDLGYQGPLLEEGALETAVTGGAASPEFTKVCAWLVSELKLYCKLEENVQATNCPSEAEGFQLEMSGLLSELCCPYPALITGEVTKRLLNANNCLLLLGFLISELESSRMSLVNHPQKKAQESNVFIELKGICMALGMSKPPANITMFQFFSGIEKKLKEALSKVPPSHIGEPLLKKPLGPVHWEKIEAINQALVNEYEVRRKMLLKRLDVTVQSFGWSGRAKTHADKLSKVYQPLRVALAAKTRVSVAHLFAAREDLSKILRTSSGHIREKTACAINKTLPPALPGGHRGVSRLAGRHNPSSVLPGKASRRHPEQMPEPPQMWRSSGSSLSSSRVTELITLYLRDRPATLRRKLISAACIQDLVLSVMTHSS